MCLLKMKAGSRVWDWRGSKEEEQNKVQGLYRKKIQNMEAV